MGLSEELFKKYFDDSKYFNAIDDFEWECEVCSNIFFVNNVEFYDVDTVRINDESHLVLLGKGGVLLAKINLSLISSLSVEIHSIRTETIF